MNSDEKSRERKAQVSTIEIYLQKTLPQQCSDATVLRMMHYLDDSQRVAVNLEFGKGYVHGVRTVLTALSLLDVEGRETIDPAHIKALRDGLEEYLSKNHI